MAHADWKRYYAVIVEDRRSGNPRRIGPIWKRRFDAETLVRSLRASKHSDYLRVMGIVGIRGRKGNPKLQGWLNRNSE